MKKVLLASLLALSASVALANPATDKKTQAEFAKIEKMISEKDFTQAHAALDKMAKQGNAQAIYNLAFLAQTGQGTRKDEKRARQLYQLAAKKGYPVASYVLAKHYMAGTLGFEQDLVKAKQLLEQASNSKFNDATIEYAVLLFSENDPKSDQAALKRLAPLIKAENPQAIHAKAIYELSAGFRNQNTDTIKSGLDSIQGLAKKGYIPALMAMGNMLVNGKLVEQDLVEAKKIFTALAEGNIPQAKESLAVVDKLIAEQAAKAQPALTGQS